MATGFYLLDHHNNVQQYGEKRRGGHEPSGTCVVHTAENVADQIGEDLGAEAVARYCLNRGDYGAYHRIVDADSIVPMAPFSYETWQCRITNPWSCGISAAVRAGDWKKYGNDYETRILRNLARAGAEFVRAMKQYWGIEVPIKHITGADARAQKPGFVGHGETDPGRRSDPGDDFDWNRFLAMVREELAGTTTPEEEPDMDKEDKARAVRIEKMLEDLHTGIAPKIPTSATKDPEWITLRAALRDTRIGVTRQLDDAVEKGVAAALADVTGVDQAAITAGVVAEVRKHVQALTESVTDTEYVLTPKEN